MSRTGISGTLSQTTPTTQTNSVPNKMSTIIGDKKDGTEASTISDFTGMRYLTHLISLINCEENLMETPVNILI